MNKIVCMILFCGFCSKAFSTSVDVKTGDGLLEEEKDLAKELETKNSLLPQGMDESLGGVLPQGVDPKLFRKLKVECVGAKMTDCRKLPLEINSLSTACAAALVSNKDLEVERNKVKMAAESVFTAAAAWRPSVEAYADAAGRRKRQNQTGNNPTTFDDSGVPNNTQKTLEGQNSGTVGLTVRQVLFAGGRIVSEVEKALQEFFSATFSLAGREQEVIFRIVESYTDVIKSQKNFEIAKMFEIYVQKLLEQTTLRYGLGDQKLADAAAARQKYKDAVRRLATTRARVASSRAKLQMLTGMSVAQDLPVPQFFKKNQRNLQKIETQALQCHPLVRSAVCKVKAARYDVMRRMSAFAPQISAEGQINKRYEGDNLSSSLKQYDTSARSYNGDMSVMVRMTMPLYQAAHFPEVRASEVAFKNSRLELEGAKRQVLEACRSAYADFAASLVGAPASWAALRDSTVALDSVFNEYTIGLGSFSDVLQYLEYWTQSATTHIEESVNLVRNSFSLALNAGMLTPKELKICVPLELDPAAYYKKYDASIFNFGQSQERTSLFEGNPMMKETGSVRR